MSKTKWVAFGKRGFWAYDVGLGVFLKYLIDVVDATGQASTPFLAEAVSSWRIAPIYDFGLHLKESWTPLQQQNVVAFVEEACARAATRESIPADEIASWPSFGAEHLFPRSTTEVATAPAVELGRAIIALLRGELQEPPEGEWWLYGAPGGRSTIRKLDSIGEIYILR